MRGRRWLAVVLWRIPWRIESTRSCVWPPRRPKAFHVHVIRFVPMSKIERRSPQDGADRWSWPAGLHPVLRQVLSRRPIAGVHELELGLKALTPVGRFDSLGPAVALLI